MCYLRCFSFGVPFTIAYLQKNLELIWKSRMLFLEVLKHRRLTTMTYKS